tara:strand:+ start:2254 stop:3189 length:936 start_codon:yes stop_codon:yes gene_type:complete
MFGIYRTYLALVVVVHHLLSVPIIGHYAVHGFFILSGYLMTYVMCRSYGYSPLGVKSFAINRFLRLFPSYWVILLLSVLAVLFFGENNSVLYREFIYIPTDIYEWTQNITLIYVDLFPGRVLPRLSPPTWALTIELIFYFLIALGLSKNKKLTTFWFLISILYMLATHIFPLGYSYRYSIVFAGTLPFSMGAMIFYYYDDVKKFLHFRFFNVGGLFLLITLNFLFSTLLEHFQAHKYFFLFSFYFNYLLNALLIISLVENKIPFISRGVDKVIGDYSYPIYLIHWQAGFVASMLIWSEPIRGFSFKGAGSF